MRNDAGRIGDRQRLNKKTWELHDVIFAAPRRGMAIAGTDREPKPLIEIARRIEIADGMNDMVKTSRHGALRVCVISPTRMLSAAASYF